MMSIARIRGIYSTSLTKLLQDFGFAITQSSQVIRERFKLQTSSVEHPTIDIHDRKDKQGVIIRANPSFFDDLNSILEKLKDIFLDLVVLKRKALVGGFYKGKVIETIEEKNISYIDLGELDGILFDCESSTGDEILVRVVEAERNEEKKKAVLSREITVPGQYAVLIPTQTVKISKRIYGPKRSSLYHLGKAIMPYNWGILWRTAAASQEPPILINEVEQLAKEAEELLKKHHTIKSPALLREGYKEVVLLFPKISKGKLDEIRSEIIPTIPEHHKLKSFGPEFSLAIDLAEKFLLQKPEEKDLIQNNLMEILSDKLPKVGQELYMDHMKLDGRIFYLGPGRIVELNDCIKIIRYFSPGGFYDGLNVPKEEGDYGITCFKENEWNFSTSYYNEDGELKGTYFNINTPIELYPGKVQYVDLEIDVLLFPDGTSQIIDEEKLREFYDTDHISETLFNKAVIVANNLLKSLEEKNT